MRVGFIVSQFPLLSETFVVSQIQGLVTRGIEVGVICDGIDTGHPDFDREPIASFVDNTRVWWSMPKHMQRTLELLPSAVRFKISAAMDVAFARKLNQFDVLVAHFGKNGARVARLKKFRLIKSPLITVFHGYDVGVPYKDNRCREYRVLFRYGDFQMPVNDVFRKMLVDAGADAPSTLVHRMGVDVTSFTYAPRVRAVGDQVRFVTVCRLVEKKGIEFSLRAFAHDVLSHRNWHYEIIGDGPLRSELESLATSLGIDDHVSFSGALPHRQVKAQLQNSHAFVLPSVTSSTGDMEGVPVALMEAMAAGLPVVSSYHSGIPELITHEVTGFLAPERDTESLAHQLIQVIDHPERAVQIAEAARAKIETDYNNTVLHDRMARILSNIAVFNRTGEAVGDR